ncbi:MAG: T9SS type A sorting domain-containing protein [Rhodothermales bacterium]
MRNLTHYLTFILALCLATSTVALADTDDDDKDRRERQASSATFYMSSTAPDPGSCRVGTAQRDLDVNNVRARLFNVGSIAYSDAGGAAEYIVPKASGHSPIFASGIWIGGQVGGELRTAAATYSDWEFWPGPLGSDGRPVNPSNCSAYDRIFKVSKSDIQTYESTGQASSDMADWPVDLGAPVIDGDGVEGNYNLSGGDRPELIGDQAIWWIMNDVGNSHNNTQAPPIGVEVRVHAFAFNRADALGNTTFYKYSVTYKGDEPLEDTYLSIFSDPDLGDAGDDYVGVDTTLSLGYVYNASDVDGVYGTPPATGYDFFQGPVSEDGDTLGVASFMYFINGGPAGTEDPQLSQEIYNVQRGFWRGGQPLREAGNGFQTDGPVTKFAFPGDPVTGEFWSEENIDGSGSAAQPGDRRLVMSTGPFTLNKGDSQDIVYGIVFAQGADRLSSISALRSADILAQAAYDADFNIPSPPPAPPLCQPSSSNEELQPGGGRCLYASEIDGKASLVWGYPSNSENYLGQFDQPDPFLSGLGLEDTTYTFEGFNVYRYPTASFASGQREHVATFDIINGVKKVTDPVFDPDVGDFVQQVSARGTDSGLQHSFQLSNLTNYTDYYYGIAAYAHSPNSTPKILESSPTNITIRPADVTARNGGTRIQSEAYTADSSATAVNQAGEGIISYRVVDPAQVTGATYQVEFFDVGTECGIASGEGLIAYSITRQSDDVAILDGCAFYERTGDVPPQRENVIVADGLSFTVVGPPKEFLDINQVTDDGEFITSLDFSLSGEPSLGDRRFFIVAQGISAPGDVLGRVDWLGNVAALAPAEFEIRFVEDAETNGQILWDYFASPGDDRVQMLGWKEGPDLADDGTYAENEMGDGRAPFQVWLIDPVSGTEQQVHAAILDDNGDGFWGISTGMAPYTLGNAAGTFERIYASDIPYSEADLAAEHAKFYNGFPARYTFGRVLFVPFGGHAHPPAAGTNVRFVTSKPNLPGDVFSVNTSGSEVVKNDAEALQEALDKIGIVPNPYRGRSAYETGNQDRRVRFTNLPQTATIRVYTVSGTLVRTLQKDGPSVSLDWNLTTDSNLPVASGMYFIHIDVPGVGEKVLKFGVINRENTINIF